MLPARRLPHTVCWPTPFSGCRSRAAYKILQLMPAPYCQRAVDLAVAHIDTLMWDERSTYLPELPLPDRHAGGGLAVCRAFFRFTWSALPPLHLCPCSALTPFTSTSHHSTLHTNHPPPPVRTPHLTTAARLTTPTKGMHAACRDYLADQFPLDRDALVQNLDRQAGAADLY